MCMLTYFPPNTAADRVALFNGGMNNPHGHGWAIAAGDRIISGKSMDLLEALDHFEEARDDNPGGPALFHSRWATHGSMGVDNVHPFIVGRSPLTVVGHNGVLPVVAHPVGRDERSDTRKFADEILSSQFRRLDRPGVQRALTQWCGSANKLVILTVDPRYRCSAYLINETAGHWDGETGIWYSNSDYVDCRGEGVYSPGDLVLERYDEWCVICGAWGGIDRQGYCEFCRYCQDCYEDVGACFCWARQQSFVGRGRMA